MVSERTEPTSPTASLSSTPSRFRRITQAEHRVVTDVDPVKPASSIETLSISSIAQRFPLPPSPVKGPRLAGTAPTSPTKASDLIKLFENRSGATLVAPALVPSTAPIAHALLAPQASKAAQRLSDAFQSPQPSPSQPPSIDTAAQREDTHNLQPERPPTPPPKPSSPVTNIRSLIASWRARAGSPSQRVIGTPGKGGDSPKLFGRDRNWPNLSIRRRHRHDGRGGSEIHNDGSKSEERGSPPLEERVDPFTTDMPVYHDSAGQAERRTPSMSSITSRSGRGSEPLVLTGEVGDSPTPSEPT